MDAGVHHHRVDNLHKNNMNNGHVVSGRGRGNHNSHHPKPKSTTNSLGDFQSPGRSNHTVTSKERQRPSDDDMSEKTKKIMDAFLKSIVDKNGVAERIRRESRNKFTMEGARDGRIPAPSGRRYHSSTNPRLVPLQQPVLTNDEKLYNIMNRSKQSFARQQSDISLASTDSAESGSKGRFQRTKSFTKAQRHSIVSELEKAKEESQQAKTLSRRSSEDMTQTLPTYFDGAHDPVINEKLADSPVSHTRASSDPVINKYDTTGRYKQQGKEKEKKGFFKRFKRKKEHKIKDDSRDSATFGDGTTTGNHSTKISKSHSDRKTVFREDSIVSIRRSPSPPGSPKRTPKLIRRLSSRIKKGGKSDSFSSKSTGRSRSFDAVEEDDEDNGEKSNSLPMEVRNSTKVEHSSNKKFKDGTVALDGPHDHSHKTGRRGRKDSAEIQRPTTLDIPKKKSNWKKFKEFFKDSSSSSESSRSSSENDLTRVLQEVNDRAAREDQVFSKGKSFDSEKARRSVKHSNSDYQQPTTDSVRGRYHHKQSKSMSDMSQQNEDIALIAMKLRKVADKYSHIIGQSQSPSRTHTPDLSKQSKGSPAVKRSTSHAPSGGKVPSHSMKTFINMSEARRARDGEGRQHRRIRREDISHRPSGSFDSPHRHPDPSHRWSDRVTQERTRRSEVHIVNERHLKKGALSPPPPSQTSSSPQRSSAPQSSSHVGRVVADSKIARSSSPRPLPPPPARSTSPNLRGSRSGHRLSDSNEHHHHYHIERHIDRTITVSSPGQTRKIHKHTDIEVEADALPSNIPDDDSTDDMTAFGDDEEVDMVTEETTILTEEIDGALSMESAPLRRQRAVTSPDFPSHYSDLDNDDEDDDDESALGAVGGTNLDTDELAKRIAKALCKKGDEINHEIDTPQLEESLTSALSSLSQEAVKEVVKQAIARVSETTRIFRNPEIVQLALIFDMAGLFVRLPQSRMVSDFLNSYIDPIVQRFGGWNKKLMSSLEETEMQMEESEVPSTSGLNQRRRNSEESDTNDELD